MSKYINRRKFLKNSFIMSASAAAGLSFEEQALLARTTKKPTIPAVPQDSIKDIPMGKIGKYNISRLLCGGNLISGFAHSRDLFYVSSLLKHYFTDEKVCETLQICEENGINSAILRLDNDVLRILNKYWNEEGGKIQWICQVKPRENDLTTDSKKAIDNGAIGVYIQGGVADQFFLNGRVDLLGKALEFIKENGVIAGMGAHLLEVPIACDKAGIEPDFYMKTLNSGNYWTAGPRLTHDNNWSPTPQQTVEPEFMPRKNDNIWSITPKQTIEFMKKINKPWIAFKVLGAGAIHPREGFKYAFENGADFITVGMYDFQIKEDILITKRVLSSNLKRQRPWCA